MFIFNTNKQQQQPSHLIDQQKHIATSHCAQTTGLNMTQQQRTNAATQMLVEHRIAVVGVRMLTELTDAMRCGIAKLRVIFAVLSKCACLAVR
jgi:limonene-1,2-epoxide hydrolase